LSAGCHTDEGLDLASSHQGHGGRLSCFDSLARRLRLSAEGDHAGVAATKPGSTQAAQAAATPIQAAPLHIGKPRPNGSNDLLQP